MVETLYQYGNNNRCFSILNDHAIRLCDIRKSNDYDELLIFYPRIFDEILTQYKQAPYPFKFDEYEGLSAMQFLVCFTEDMFNEKIESGAFSNFVTCFSEKPDVLSQWRGYANDGKGCCLGFSAAALQKHCELSSGILRLEKVRYVTKEQISEIIHKAATDIVNGLRGLREWIVAEMTHDDNAEATDDLLSFNFSGMIEETLTDSLIYKGIGFIEEEEWRLFLRGNAYKEPTWVLGEDKKMLGPKGFSETLTYLRNKIGFNVTDDNLSLYVPIHFSEFQSTPLQEIWLGPKNRISESDLKLYLSSKGYDNIKIYQSKISYR